MAVAFARLRLLPASFVLVCFGSAWLASTPTHAAPTVANEPEIKAQFFERFTRFIDWPESALAKGAPFVVCLTGANQLATEIEHRMARTTVKGSPTQVRRLATAPAPDPGGCHALYLAPGFRAHLPALLARTRGRPILTVADTEGFARQGVLINMYIDERFVRFEINDPALRASGLKASSKLLRLARMVDSAPP